MKRLLHIALVCSVLAGFTLTAVACKGNRWYGTFAGKTTVTSTVQRPSKAVTDQHHGGVAIQDNDEPTLEREGKVAFLTFRKCRLRMDLDDDTHAHVSDGQTCTIVIDGESSRMSMKGTVVFEEADSFTAHIAGAPTEAGVSGEYVWNFQGSRK